MDENDVVNLLTLYTRPEISVSREDIPAQDDVEEWSYLQGVVKRHVDAGIGLPIASDVSEALDPLEIKHGQCGGPYAPMTCIGWAVNGPPGRRRSATQTSGFRLRLSRYPASEDG